MSGTKMSGTKMSGTTSGVPADKLASRPSIQLG